jgi:hypothetical protein
MQALSPTPSAAGTAIGREPGGTTPTWMTRRSIMDHRYDDESRFRGASRQRLGPRGPESERDRAWFDRTKDEIRDTFGPADRDEFRYGSRYAESATDTYRPYGRSYGYGNGFRTDPALGEYRSYGGYGGASGDRYGYHGRGPKSFRRTDERIREDVAQALTESAELDATDIELDVDDGCVTLRGTVLERRAKRLAEDLAERVWGVVDVRNELRVDKSNAEERSGRREDDPEPRVA